MSFAVPRKPSDQTLGHVGAGCLCPHGPSCPLPATGVGYPASISWERALGVASWSRVREEVLLGGLATDLTQRLFHQAM